jgi:beta-aspartyl-peptidase (threonine type)
MGEAIIRVGLARTALELLRSGLEPARAAEDAIARLALRTGAEAGLIVVDRDGRVGYAHSAPHMSVASLPE